MLKYNQRQEKGTPMFLLGWCLVEGLLIITAVVAGRSAYDHEREYVKEQIKKGG